MYSKYILIVNIFYGFTEGTTPFRKVYRNLAIQLLSSLLALPLERSNNSEDFPKRRRRLRRVHILKGYLLSLDNLLKYALSVIYDAFQESLLNHLISPVGAQAAKITVVSLGFGTLS